MPKKKIWHNQGTWGDEYITVTLISDDTYELCVDDIASVSYYDKYGGCQIKMWNGKESMFNDDAMEVIDKIKFAFPKNPIIL